MTIADVSTILPNPDDSLSSWCRHYRARCGIDAWMQPELKSIIVLASNSLGAVTMPAELGAQVKIHLLRLGVRLGPIISHPRSSRWTFLIRPDIPTDTATSARLFRIHVSVARSGAQITLPSPERRRSDLGFRCWSCAPEGDYRPSGMVVLNAVDALRGPWPTPAVCRRGLTARRAPNHTIPQCH
ncbi:DNA-directed RNA polymerase subunit beta (plasmid) [Nocardia sp. CA-084685]|uniref:DNA-directed RNA polymerase subunit beta n=1 Tax=Nocardia sp. CA-084685 TaxID=3239970 RepID=UPI003D96B22A